MGDRYIGGGKGLEWKCKDGHTFSMSYESIRSGCWCPLCSGSKGESITRGVMERIFKSSFDKKRVIRVEGTGRLLELDGYSEELGIAFEYQGEQHYRFVPFYHKDRGEFEKRVTYDGIKERWCKDNGVSLVIVNEFKELNNMEEILCEIEAAIRKAGLEVPGYDSPKRIGDVYIGNMESFRRLCGNKGIKVRDEAFVGWNERYEVECRTCGNVWKTTATSLRNGGCPRCGIRERSLKSRRYDIGYARSLAEEKGGKCLSGNESITATENLEWYCNRHNFKWKASLTRIRFNGWCPKCGREKCDENRKCHTIEELRCLAAERGGKCLSLKYTNVGERYEWMCSKGHSWMASYSDIKGTPKHKPTWCPFCAGKDTGSRQCRQMFCRESVTCEAEVTVLWKKGGR